MTESARNDKNVLLLLTGGLVIQVLTAILTIGAYHPDAHFHIIEYAMYLQGLPSRVADMWEMDERMMPTFKVYLFAAFYKAMHAVGMTDRYGMLTILRVLISIANWLLINYLIIRNIPRKNKRALYAALFIFNFSWWFPYLRTSFSAEMISSILFFGGVLLYQVWSDKKPLNFFQGALVGLILSLAFYARFQIAFAGLGFIIWLLFSWKKHRQAILYMAIGFIAGLVANTALDSMLYGELAITPFNYFRVNIVEGKAASFGTSSVLFYIAILAIALLAPPLSVLLFGLTIRGAIRHFRDPYVLATVFFIIGHCLVAHKEDRFLFPVFGVLPLIVGYVLPDYQGWYERLSSLKRRSFQGMFIFSLLLNAFALAVFMIIPYSQGIEFGRRVNKYFSDTDTPVYVYSQRRTPFQTSSLNHLAFYQEPLNENVQFWQVRRFPVISEQDLQAGDTYLCTTYNDLHRNTTDPRKAARYTPVFYSSKLLWDLNEWLRGKGVNTIDEIWVMYRVN